MSLINHIIIPIVGSRQNLQQVNVFKHASLSLTPEKAKLPSQPIIWKKSMSAFKKFKQKKDKKDKKGASNSPEKDLSHQQIHATKFKLVTKLRKSLLKTDNQTIQPSDDQYSTPPPYYDPNEASLYEFNACDLPNAANVKQAKVIAKHDLILPTVSESKVLKVEAEAKEEQNQIFFSVQPRSDDPFIIVRKGNLKKSSKITKPKSVKKQKWEKYCLKEQDQQLSPDKRRLQPPNSSIKICFQVKNNEKSSSQQGLPKNTRQIFTLSQIKKTAFEEKVEENRKNGKQKDSVSRELNFAETKLNSQ